MQRTGLKQLQKANLPLFERPRHFKAMWPIESFTVFDDQRVDHEPLSASVRITAPDEVGVYLKAFATLHRHAAYGADARALVVRAIESLPQPPPRC
ncbi:hypothetical protein [Streptomyces sp. CA-111067]|uniref:hypothetical protein n=1 Tax=Streptomyces sp. CA-111067 TaxID=3240046 RepID=UPI003D964828